MSSAELKKTMGLFDAAAIVAGSMIGSGIFIVSSDIAAQVNSVYLLILIWIISGVMTLIGALCYGELAAAMPQAGGQYVYLKKIWGEATGFLYGWTLCLVIQTGTIAAVAAAFAKFSGILFPLLSPQNFFLDTSVLKISFQQVLAIFLIAILTFINTRGLKYGIILQNIFTSAKIMALIAVIICGLAVGANQEALSLNFSSFFFIPDNHLNVFSLVSIALVGALFSSDAWNNVTFVASEIKNPSKNLPLALLSGVFLVTLLYLLTNFAYLSVLELGEIKSSQDGVVAASMMSVIFGGAGKIAICGIILVSAFGCLNGMILSGARVLYAMAEDGVFFRQFSKLHEKYEVPVNALLLQGVWASVLVLSGSYSQLLDYIIFAALVFYILTVGGIFVFRAKNKDSAAPLNSSTNYRVPLYPVLPALYCVLAAFVAVNLLIFKPAYTIPGMIIVLSGIPVYYARKFLSEAMQKGNI